MASLVPNRKSRIGSSSRMSTIGLGFGSFSNLDNATTNGNLEASRVSLIPSDIGQMSLGVMSSSSLNVGYVSDRGVIGRPQDGVRTVLIPINVQQAYESYLQSYINGNESCAPFSLIEAPSFLQNPNSRDRDTWCVIVLGSSLFIFSDITELHPVQMTLPFKCRNVNLIKLIKSNDGQRPGMVVADGVNTIHYLPMFPDHNSSLVDLIKYSTSNMPAGSCILPVVSYGKASIMFIYGSDDGDIRLVTLAPGRTNLESRVFVKNSVPERHLNNNNSNNRQPMILEWDASSQQICVVSSTGLEKWKLIITSAASPTLEYQCYSSIMQEMVDRLSSVFRRRGLSPTPIQDKLDLVDVKFAESRLLCLTCFDLKDASFPIEWHVFSCGVDGSNVEHMCRVDFSHLSPSNSVMHRLPTSLIVHPSRPYVYYVMSNSSVIRLENKKKTGEWYGKAIIGGTCLSDGSAMIISSTWLESTTSSQGYPSTTAANTISSSKLDAVNRSNDVSLLQSIIEDPSRSQGLSSSGYQHQNPKYGYTDTTYPIEPTNDRGLNDLCGKLYTACKTWTSVGSCKSLCDGLRLVAKNSHTSSQMDDAVRHVCRYAILDKPLGNMSFTNSQSGSALVSYYLLEKRRAYDFYIKFLIREKLLEEDTSFRATCVSDGENGVITVPSVLSEAAQIIKSAEALNELYNNNNICDELQLLVKAMQSLTNCKIDAALNYFSTLTNAADLFNEFIKIEDSIRSNYMNSNMNNRFDDIVRVVNCYMITMLYASCNKSDLLASPESAPTAAPLWLSVDKDIPVLMSQVRFTSEAIQLLHKESNGYAQNFGDQQQKQTILLQQLESLICILMSAWWEHEQLLQYTNSNAVMSNSINDNRKEMLQILVTSGPSMGSAESALAISEAYHIFDFYVPLLQEIVSKNNDGELELKEELVNMFEIHSTPFSDALFRYYYDSQQWYRLLDLPDVFLLNLTGFLSRHHDLQWYHDIHEQRYDCASAALRQVTSMFVDLNVDEYRSLLCIGKLCDIIHKLESNNYETIGNVESDLWYNNNIYLIDSQNLLQGYDQQSIVYDDGDVIHLVPEVPRAVLHIQQLIEGLLLRPDDPAVYHCMALEVLDKAYDINMLNDSKICIDIWCHAMKLNDWVSLFMNECPDTEIQKFIHKSVLANVWKDIKIKIGKGNDGLQRLYRLGIRPELAPELGRIVLGGHSSDIINRCCRLLSFLGHNMVCQCSLCVF